MSTGGNNNAYLRSLRVFSITLMSGLILFTILVLTVNSFEPAATDVFQGYTEFVTTFLIVVAIVCFVVARQMFRRKTEAIKNTSVNVSDKLNQYRAALISYMALCDGPAIFAIVLFFLTGIHWLLLVVLMMLLAMAMKFPTKQKLMNDLELDWKEQQELE